MNQRERDDFVEQISYAVETERCRIGGAFGDYMREKAMGRSDVARAMGCMPWDLTAFQNGEPQNFGAIRAKISEVFPEFSEHSNHPETQVTVFFKDEKVIHFDYPD